MSAFRRWKTSKGSWQPWSPQSANRFTLTVTIRAGRGHHDKRSGAAHGRAPPAAGALCRIAGAERRRPGPGRAGARNMRADLTNKFLSLPSALRGEDPQTYGAGSARWSVY